MHQQSLNTVLTQSLSNFFERRMVKMWENFFSNYFLSTNKRVPNYSICNGHLMVVQLVNQSVIAMRSEDLKAVTVRITEDWDVTPHILVIVSKALERICCHIQSQSVMGERNVRKKCRARVNRCRAFSESIVINGWKERKGMCGSLSECQW
jgi:hypothetical protein